MSKKETQKAGAVVTGLTVIAGAIAHYKKTKKWEDIHTLLVLIGAGLAFSGATS